MTAREFFSRVRQRLVRYGVGELLAGWWFSRHLTRHGIIVASGGHPWPKVINRGGVIHTENCQFYGTGREN
jgi:hypothetical protein